MMPGLSSVVVYVHCSCNHLIVWYVYEFARAGACGNQNNSLQFTIS